MASLSVRKIDDDLYRQLQERARRHGVSMEEEVRRILRQTVSAPERLGDLAATHFAGLGVDLELPPRDAHEPVDLGE